MHSRNEKLNDDVSKRNEASKATCNGESDWSKLFIYPQNQEKSLPDLSERQENGANFSDGNSANGNDAQSSPKGGNDFIVPETSQNDERNKNLSPRGGRYNLRPNANPNYSEDFRY